MIDKVGGNGQSEFGTKLFRTKTRKTVLFAVDSEDDVIVIRRGGAGGGVCGD